MGGATARLACPLPALARARQAAAPQQAQVRRASARAAGERFGEGLTCWPQKLHDARRKNAGSMRVEGLKVLGPNSRPSSWNRFCTPIEKRWKALGWYSRLRSPRQ